MPFNGMHKFLCSASLFYAVRSLPLFSILPLRGEWLNTFPVIQKPW